MGEDYETIFAITQFCVWKEVTGNISCIFKSSILLWGVDVLEASEARTRKPVWG